MFLKLFKTNANTVGGGLPVLTGPGFVDKSNAATVEKLAGRAPASSGTRVAGASRAGHPPLSHEERDVISKHAMASGSVPAPAARGGRRRRPSRSATSGWRRSARWRALLRRPEIGALLAAVVVAIFFWTQNSLFLKLDGIANWTDVASTIGIPAVARRAADDRRRVRPVGRRDDRLGGPDDGHPRHRGRA